MLTRFLIFMLIVTAVIRGEAQETEPLHIFNNGSVADADEINANFTNVNTRIVRLEQFGGCSVAQEGNAVVIACADGTSGVLSGSGETIILPEGGVTAEAPFVSVPSGEIVWIDANDSILGLSYGQYIGLGEGGPIDGIISSREQYDGPIVTNNQPFTVYYIEPDCSGVPFVVRTSSIHDMTHFYLVAAPDTPALGRTLFFARRSTGYGAYVPSSDCSEGEFVVSGAVAATQYFLSSVLQNAVYPLRIEQLP